MMIAHPQPCIVEHKHTCIRRPPHVQVHTRIALQIHMPVPVLQIICGGGLLTDDRLLQEAETPAPLNTWMRSPSLLATPSPSCSSHHQRGTACLFFHDPLCSSLLIYSAQTFSIISVCAPFHITIPLPLVPIHLTQTRHQPTSSSALFPCFPNWSPNVSEL